MPEISILSSFPPIKGVTHYTIGLVKELDKTHKINFIGFKSIYPEFAYAGGSKDNSIETPKLDNAKVWNGLTWYNPFSWVIAGFRVKGHCLHVQWWSWILAPIYLTVISIAKFIKKKPIIITAHNIFPHEKSFIKELFNKSVFLLWDKFIVHSQDNKKQLREIVGGKKEIRVIPHGIIVPKTKNIEKNKARESYKIGMKEKVLLFFGNIRDYKGLDIALKALVELVKKDNGYKLIIAGACWEDWGKYQKIIDENSLNKNVLHLDWFIKDDDLGRLFGSADLLVLPYKHFDAQSGVVAINFTFETPLIVSDLEGLTEVISDEDLVFRNGDSEDLSKKIDNLFENKLLKEKITYIKKKKKLFEWNEIVKKTLDFYNLNK